MSVVLLESGSKTFLESGSNLLLETVDPVAAAPEPGIAVLGFTAQSPFTFTLTPSRARGSVHHERRVLVGSHGRSSARTEAAHTVTLTAAEVSSAHTATEHTVTLADTHQGRKVDTVASALWERDRARDDLIAVLAYQ